MEPADGLSGGVRTHGLLIPNQARFQLRHTQMIARLSGLSRLTDRRPRTVFAACQRPFAGMSAPRLFRGVTSCRPSAALMRLSQFLHLFFPPDFFVNGNWGFLQLLRLPGNEPGRAGH